MTDTTTHASPADLGPDTVAPGVTEWSTLGAVQKANKLPSGVSFALHPWLGEDQVWIGDQAARSGATTHTVLRAQLGWLVSFLDGEEMERSERERKQPHTITTARTTRESAVNRLTYGDWFTLLVLLAAEDEDSMRWDARCHDAECKQQFPVDFALADLPLRIAITEDRTKLTFEEAGRVWGPTHPLAFNGIPLDGKGHSAKAQWAILEHSFVSGPAFSGKGGLTRRETKRVMEELDRRLLMPRFVVQGNCPTCGEDWVGALPLDRFLAAGG